MIPIPKYLKLGAIALSSLALCAQAAQAPQHIDVKQLSKKVEDVVVREVQPGGIVITMGAGDVTLLSDRLVEGLVAR